MIRLSVIISLLAAAFWVAGTNNPWLLISSLPAGFFIYLFAWKSLAKSMRALIPVTVFIVLLSSLQWLYQGFHFEFSAKILTVFFLTTSSFRLVPWDSCGNVLHPGSKLAVTVLYLLFMRHFALILAVESRRLLTARSRSIFKPYGRWSFRSLASALGSLFLRAMNRAERFYAAQILKGF